jgi:hypothetical protein
MPWARARSLKLPNLAAQLGFATLRHSHFRDFVYFSPIAVIYYISLEMVAIIDTI